MRTEIGFPTHLHTHLARHQRQVCHSRRHQQLEQRPGSSEVSGLSHSELHQAGQSVFHNHAPPAVLRKAFAPTYILNEPRVGYRMEKGEERENAKP